jgi:aspartate carbamoyltransferase catalytic subunit
MNSFKKINKVFKNKSFVSINQLSSKLEVNIIFKTADQMKKLVENKKANGLLKKYCIAELFYQPSTRTFTSFLGAANWLGAMTVPIHGMSAYSSAVKGESLSDSIRSIHQTTAADLIILRHPDDDSSEIAAKHSYVPIINAGSGKKEHPTQAILDLYTIRQIFKKTDTLKVAMVGDLKNGRTVKSLSLLLALMSKTNKIIFVSPDSLRTPMSLLNQLKDKGLDIYETDNLNSVISKADVLYVTRIQKEWFAKEEEYQKVASSYTVDQKLLRKAKKKMIVMHPLPRVSEISNQVDNDPRAYYFQQMRSGLYTRMALLKLILLGS